MALVRPLSVLAANAVGGVPRARAARGQAPRPAVCATNRSRKPESGTTDLGPEGARRGAKAITLFLAGDVMTGRGIDQALPHPSDPGLHEPYVTSAVGYLELAESASGPIPWPVDFSYVWGDALSELARVAPDLRIVNLETAVTTSDDYWPGKGIHYRMHPDNMACLTTAQVDCCVLANNHVLDWGYAGLQETLDSLHRARIATAGAGRNRREAESPAVLAVPGKGRVVVLSFAFTSSGVPWEWGATKDKAGVWLLEDLSGATAEGVGEKVRAIKRPGDIVVASIHWGGNWGYGIAPEQRRFARQLIDEGGVDVVHGHSSHHPKGIEIHRGRPIFYGCGDLLNDYEGIRGYEQFRGNLALLYFVSLDPSTGRLARLEMTPVRVERLKLNRASAAEARWLAQVMNRQGEPLGTRVELADERALSVHW